MNWLRLEHCWPSQENITCSTKRAIAELMLPRWKFYPICSLTWFNNEQLICLSTTIWTFLAGTNRIWLSCQTSSWYHKLIQQVCRSATWPLPKLFWSISLTVTGKFLIEIHLVIGHILLILSSTQLISALCTVNNIYLLACWPIMSWNILSDGQLLSTPCLNLLDTLWLTKESSSEIKIYLHWTRLFHEFGEG